MTQVLVPGKGRETWGVMALKGGLYECLWGQAQGMRRVNGTFPLAGSRDEAEGRVVAKIETDQEFAERFDGWTFFFVDLARAVECKGAT